MFDQISIGVCFYNDPSIYRLLDSLPREVKKIMVDGKFEFNEDKPLLSPEDMRDRIKEYDNVTLIDMPNVPEPRKRDQYLINNDHKYLIILDSDEYIAASKWEEFFEGIANLKDGIHDIFTEVDAEGHIGAYPRLWVNPKEWRYTMCHNIFKNFNGTVAKSGDTHGKTIPGLLIGTDDTLRGKEYLDNVSAYQGRMMEFERPYRHKYRDGDMTPFG